MQKRGGMSIKMNKNKRGKNKKLYEDELKCKVGNRKEGEGEE